jgi:phenylacetate-CoA ligase
MKTYWAEEIETMPAAELLRRQLAQAGGQAARTADRSAFHRERLAGLAVGDGGFRDLDAFAEAVPYSSKEQVIAAQLQLPPYGGLLAVPEDELVRYYVYPAGQILGWSALDQATLEDMYAGGLWTAGIRPDDRVDVTFQYHWVVAGTIWDSAVRHLGAAAVPGGAGESARHAAALSLLRVTTLIGFSTFMERIAASAVEEGLVPAALSVKKMIIVGEWHGSDAKASIADLYGGADVREAYGTGETGLVAAECDGDANGMHVHPDILLEVRHESRGTLVGEGEGGEVFLTPLKADAMPMLRFRTGDITESVRYEVCACGRTTPRIGRIIGRSGQMLRVKGIFLSRPLVASVVNESVPGQAVFQLWVDRPSGQDRLRLHIECAEPLKPETVSGLVRRMRAKAAVSVEVEAVPVGSYADTDPWFIDARASQQ